MKAVVFICAAMLFGTAHAQDNWNGADKKQHFVISTAFGIAAGRTWPDNKLKAFGVALIPGLIKETMDRSTTGFSGKDMVWNALGAFVGVQLGSWSVEKYGSQTVVSYRTQF